MATERLDDAEIEVIQEYLEHDQGHQKAIEYRETALNLLRDLQATRAALRQWKCPDCRGVGKPQPSSYGTDCFACNGTGLHPVASEALGETPTEEK